jgi:hypothetical protein
MGEVWYSKEICKGCGDDYLMRHGARGRPQEFCTDDCRAEYFRLNPPRPAFWNVDEAAAIAELGLEHPVVIYKPGHLRTKGGSHRFRKGMQFHEVKVFAYYDIDRAGQVLWHELEHARQHEAGELENVAEVKRQYRCSGVRLSAEAVKRYNSMPHEAKAIAAEDNHDRLPLTRKV